MVNRKKTLEEVRKLPVFTTGQAAKICKVSQQTIIRCFDNGTLKGFRVPGSRFRRIPRDELFAFMKDNGIPMDAFEGGNGPIELNLLVTDALHEQFQNLLGGKSGTNIIHKFSDPVDLGLRFDSVHGTLVVQEEIERITSLSVNGLVKELSKRQQVEVKTPHTIIISKKDFDLPEGVEQMPEGLQHLQEGDQAPDELAQRILEERRAMLERLGYN